MRESIGVFNDVPSIDFDTEDRPDIPVFTQHAPQVEAPRVNYNPHYNPFTPDASSPSSSVPCDGELQDLGEDHSLGVTLLVLHLEEVFLEEDAVMGAALVDNHQRHALCRRQ